MNKTTMIALSILALVGGAVVADAYGETPLHMVTANVKRPALRGVLERLREFGDAHGFAVRIDQSSPDPNDLLLQMWRTDMKIIGADASDSGAPDVKYLISIFQNCNDDVPKPAFDDVATDLQEALSATKELPR